MSSAARLLMCAPTYFGIEYEINPWMNRLVASDPVESLLQWQALYHTIRDLGARIETLDPIQGLPDLVFTANAGLVYDNVFVSSRFRHGVRQGETPYYDAWAREHGFEVLSLPADYYFEGAGDALFCGDTLYGGYRFRSDAKSHHWVGARLGVQVLPLELVDPRFYHLDTCFCPISENTAIYYPGAFDDYGRHVLRERIPNLLAVSEAEAITFCCNAVVIGDTIVINDGAPNLARALKDSGYGVRVVRLTEFLKAGGSAKCLTLRLDGEEAAHWKRFESLAGSGSHR
ncbi:dimethylarginine dimethylaminohydrolase family protein [Singulisphaera sp. PoT]|uniref:dimethylarginine dimethylaminohydrolase family protein n=1 Tax=Singulisphaera sp. PoT TaxID=3411797 RepID=UPI003BF539BB